MSILQIRRLFIKKNIKASRNELYDVLVNSIKIKGILEITKPSKPYQ
jgi:hypothetical protein